MAVITVINESEWFFWLIHTSDGGWNERFKGRLGSYSWHFPIMPPSRGEKIILVLQEVVGSDKTFFAISSVLGLCNCSQLVSSVQHFLTRILYDFIKLHRYLFYLRRTWRRCSLFWILCFGLLSITKLYFSDIWKPSIAKELLHAITVICWCSSYVGVLFLEHGKLYIFVNLPLQDKPILSTRRMQRRWCTWSTTSCVSRQRAPVVDSVNGWVQLGSSSSVCIYYNGQRCHFYFV